VQERCRKQGDHSVAELDHDAATKSVCGENHGDASLHARLNVFCVVGRR
jgi:hypothetical protein